MDDETGAAVEWDDVLPEETIQVRGEVPARSAGLLRADMERIAGGLGLEVLMLEASDVSVRVEIRGRKADAERFMAAVDESPNRGAVGPSRD